MPSFITNDKYVPLYNLYFYHSRKFFLCSYLINSYHPGTTPLLISITLNKFCLFYNFTNESHSSISVSASFTKNNAFEIYTCCCVYHWALLFYCWLICFLLAPLSHGTFPYLQPPALVVRSNRTLSKDSPSRGRKTCM